MNPVTDISATVTPIGVKFYMMVHIGSGHKARYLQESPKSKMLALEKANISKTQRYMTIRA